MKYFLLLSFILFSFIGCEDPGAEKVAEIKFNPDSIIFNITPVNETDTKILTITNSGNKTLDITSITVTQNEGIFTIDDNLSFPLKIAPNDDYELNVYYKPVDSANITGKLYFETNASNVSAGNTTVYLKTQVSNALIEVLPESITFEDVVVNEIKEMELTVRNTGTSPLLFDNGENPAIHFGPGTHTAFTLENTENIRTLNPLTIDDNGEEVYDFFTVKLKYKATGDSDETGTIIIHNNSVNSSPTKVIPISGNSQACRLLLQPADAYIDFGERPIDSENSFTVTLSNAGTGKCNIAKVELDDARTGPEFTMLIPETPAIPFDLQPGERYDFKIYFRPTDETGAGGSAGVVTIETDDPYWTNGKKEITLFGSSKEDNTPVCIIQNLAGGAPYFEVEPGQRENVECNGSGVCSNVQMISKSYDPLGENISLTWRMVESPASYTNSAWITYPARDPDNLTNADKHYVDFYVPYATPPGTRYYVELTVRNTSGLQSSCYGEIQGLTGNSLHIELFWEKDNDVDLHVANPVNQSLRLDQIDSNHPSLDSDLIAYRTTTNTDWWDSTSDRDCYFGNCTRGEVEWGLPGEADNPSLDRDDVTYKGPENTNIAKPKEGWYRVAIHYYRDDYEGDVGNWTTVRIYCNGVIAYQQKALLVDENYWWFVGDIYWKPQGDTGICYIYNDGRIFNARNNPFGQQVDDVEPDQD